MIVELRQVTHAEQWLGQEHPRVWRARWFGHGRPFITVDLAGDGYARLLAPGEWILSRPSQYTGCGVMYWVVPDHEFKKFYALAPDGTCAKKEA